jgi:hypothetical protein
MVLGCTLIAVGVFIIWLARASIINAKKDGFLNRSGRWISPQDQFGVSQFVTTRYMMGAIGLVWIGIGVWLAFR